MVYKKIDQILEWMSNPAFKNDIVEIKHSIANYKLQLKRLYAEKGISVVVQEVYETMDHLHSEALKKGQVTCKKGCSHCCTADVELTQYEFDYLLSYCKNNSVRIDMQYVNELLNKERVLPGSIYSEKCVFLKDNLCSIYFARPLECRAYLVSSPVENCSQQNFLTKKLDVLYYWEWDLMSFVSAAVSFFKSESRLLPDLLNEQAF